MILSYLRIGLPVALAIIVGSAFGVTAQTPPQNGAALAAALHAAEAEKWENAATLARQNQDPIAAEIIEWNLLRAGIGSFTQYETFLNSNADWPGLPLLQKVSEQHIPEA